MGFSALGTSSSGEATTGYTHSCQSTNKNALIVVVGLSRGALKSGTSNENVVVVVLLISGRGVCDLEGQLKNMAEKWRRVLCVHIHNTCMWRRDVEDCQSVVVGRKSCKKRAKTTMISLVARDDLC